MILTTVEYSLDLEVTAEIKRGRPAVTDGPPESCTPYEPPEVLISDVWILREDGLPSQRLVEVSPSMLDVLAMEIVDQADDGDLWEVPK